MPRLKTPTTPRRRSAGSAPGSRPLWPEADKVLPPPAGWAAPGQSALGSAARARGSRSPDVGSLQLLGAQAKSPLPGGVVLQRGLERRRVEIRPKPVGEIQLGIGQVPQQEVADALFAAGANEQVRVADITQRQRRSKSRLIELRWRELMALDLQRQAACRVHDVAPAAVAERDLQQQAGVRGGNLLGAGHAGLQPRVQLVALADEAHAHPAAVQFLDLGLERLDEQRHQAHDLIARAAPVFAAEGEQR